MIDLCNCCKECSLRRRETGSSISSFPKKLLIAVSIVVIITMCLMPAEARVVESTWRHRRHENSIHSQKSTKDTSGPAKRQRHNADIFSSATDKVLRKLKNVKRYLYQDQKKFHEKKEFKDGKATWLPKVNFLNIHYHNYSIQDQRMTITEMRFKHLVPKLYKSLLGYEKVFEVVSNATKKFEDDLAKDIKNNKWVEAITTTRYNLNLFITEVEDQMRIVNIDLPELEKSRINLEQLNQDTILQCVKNNYLTFRGYSALLRHWHSEFTCTRFRNVRGAYYPRSKRDTSLCKAYLKWLQNRRKDIKRKGPK